MSETPELTVYGVWSGPEEAELSFLFLSREAAERYAQARNVQWLAQWAEYNARMIAKWEAADRPDVVAALRTHTCEPLYFVTEMLVYASPEAAHPKLFAPEDPA